MERGFLSLGGRVVKQKRGLNVVDTVASKGNVGEGIANTTILKQNLKTTHACASVYKDEDVKSSKVNEGFNLEMSQSDYDVALPIASVHKVNERMKNSLYGYFISKRLAFPIVEWFGTDYVLRDGPWMILGIPIFLNKLSHGVCLLKEDLSRVPIWVKFHDVPLVVYTSDGLSLIASKIGTPMMLDLYTNNMCFDSWGMSSYARSLIEINASNKFRDNLILAIPKLNGSRYTKESIRIEVGTPSLWFLPVICLMVVDIQKSLFVLKWEPLRCGSCLLYGHSHDDCPKAAPKRLVNGIDKGSGQSSGVSKKASNSNDGVTIVKQKGLNPKKFNGVPMNKFEYRPVVQKNTKAPNSNDKTNVASTSRQLKMIAKVVSTSNTFGVLGELDEASNANVEPSGNVHTPLVVGDDGKPLEPCKLPSSKKVVYPDHTDSDDEVLEVYNELLLIWLLRVRSVWAVKELDKGIHVTAKGENTPRAKSCTCLSAQSSPKEKH
ncbi:zinc knuckle CX2CX4HX4C [Artemisia annua]|uniref:Zinc knuckle CX2CX4HX4C n=1 Tax=Artemisia annua TaxID=35608 RepID=A0A2U1PVS4_ARTAN|nr:zinc knuckle CX2CX4HX4C [Artemisia annua]